MSGDDPTNETENFELSRRTFTKAAGAAVGAGLLGASANTAAAQDGRPLYEFTNPRVQELKKVWDRGYRGRADRTIGLTDSGIDARHPDLGPWNGIHVINDDGDFTLVDSEKRNIDVSDPMYEFTASAQATPGTFATGQEVVVKEFAPDDDAMADSAVDFVDATLTWSPSQQNANDLEFRLDKKNDDGEWVEVARTATGSVPEKITGAPIETGTAHRFVAEAYVNTVSQVEVSGGFFDRTVISEGSIPSDETPFSYGPDNSKTIGWVDPDSRFGTLDKPRDPDGHGSHCSSIMGGSGRASEIAREVHHGGSQQVVAGDAVLEIVEVEAGEGGAYAAAYGDNLEIELYRDDGQTATSAVGSDTSEFDNNVVSMPAEPGDSFEVRIRASQVPNAETIAQGLATAGQIDSYSIGTFAAPDASDGDRTEGDGVALHSGVAPNASLLGLQGFSAPVATLAEFGDEFRTTFNLRSVNMSWGYTGGLPLGGFGQGLDGGVVANIKTMAEKGIMTVAAAGNAATPANGNGAPAVADEAISVVATGPRDGIVAYSSGGIGGNDEDGEGTYMKPDVTAPGGSLTDLIQAAKADTNTENFDEDTEPRDYTGKAGTSMASPFTNGVVGLVANAMEDGDAFDEGSDGLLPAPAETGFDDLMRLKQVVLATATETAFTAAPYHRGKAPSYQFGGRDPFEGYGRVNPDAAVDAVTQNMYGGGRTLSDFGPNDDVPVGTEYFGEVGLDVPRDSRAVAGFIEAPSGELEIPVAASDLAGADAGMAAAGPQIDVFVYDAENPAANGEPNVVAKSQILDGSPTSLTVYTDGTSLGQQEQVDSAVGSIDVADGETRTLFVVAKLVNVPGLVNGFDARTEIQFAPQFTPDPLPAFVASGTRTDSGDRFVAGASNRVQVTLDSMEVDSGRIVDKVPKDWGTPREGFGDYQGVIRTTDTHRIIDLGTVSQSELANGSVSRNYTITAPDSNGSYTFGPASILVEDADESEPGVQTKSGGETETYRNEKADFTATDPQNIVVGGTSTSSGGSSSDPISTVTDGTSTSDGGSTTDTVTSTVEDTL